MNPPRLANSASSRDVVHLRCNGLSLLRRLVLIDCLFAAVLLEHKVNGMERESLELGGHLIDEVLLLLLGIEERSTKGEDRPSIRIRLCICRHLHP